MDVNIILPIFDSLSVNFKERNRMIKTHLIGCSGLLLLTIAFIVYTDRIKHHPLKNRAQTEIISVSEPKEEEVKVSEARTKAPSFANEKIPLHDKKVAYRMYRVNKTNNVEPEERTKLHKRAKKFFPIVEPILVKYGIPKDFKYIPLVESGFERHTSSYRGASGYWQFMPGTARTYGLTVNRSVDERADIRKSTVAACLYFQELYKEFKNWTLVAAAYNYGETKLWNQIVRQKHRNYYNLKLNRETATYVYKLVSMKELIEKASDKHYNNLKSPRLANTGDLPGIKTRFVNPRFTNNSFAGFSTF